MAASCCSTALSRPHSLWGGFTELGYSPAVGSPIRAFISGSEEARKSVRVSCIGDNNKTALVTSKSWDKVILNSYTSWCGPCCMVHQVINEIAINYSRRLTCYVLNSNNDPKVTENYDIKAVPVVLLFENGQKLDSVGGTMPKEFYVPAIERVLCSDLSLKSC